jgi:hypothetical protein
MALQHLQTSLRPCLLHPSPLSSKSSMPRLSLVALQLLPSIPLHYLQIPLVDGCGALTLHQVFPARKGTWTWLTAHRLAQTPMHVLPLQPPAQRRHSSRMLLPLSLLISARLLVKRGRGRRGIRSAMDAPSATPTLY